MSIINVTNIKVGNNCSRVTDPLVFRIEFESLGELKHDIEWKIIYITTNCDDDNTNKEIVLDEIYLGPIKRGVLAFEFNVDPPDYKLLGDNILGIQAILVTSSYNNQEFIRIGYYVNNTYEDEELRECPPVDPIIDKIVRCIIEQPRVTRFPIEWDKPEYIDDSVDNGDLDQQLQVSKM